MIRPRYVALWVVLLYTWTGTTHAAQTIEDEELALVYGDKSSVSIATGSKQSIRRAPAVATVITAEDIAAMGAVNLDDVLETVPGIHVNRSNESNAPLYDIRGIHSELNPQTLMLQNGVPMTTLFVGNRGIIWGGLPIENIARIEIIRGPGSALYGADAYSGVINIITKSAADVPDTEVGLRAGSFRTRDGWVQGSGKLGSADVATYLRAGHTDGFKRTVTADAQTNLDTAFGTNASLAPGSVNNGYDSFDGSLDVSHDKLKFRAGYKLRDNMGTGAGIANALDPVGKLKSERITADISLNDVEIAQDWRMGLTASYLHYHQDIPVPLQLFPPGAFGGSFPEGMIGAPNTWERQIRLSAVATYSGRAHHNLRVGAGHDDLDLYKTKEFTNFILTSGLPVPFGSVREVPPEQSFLTPHRRKIDYLYTQDEWNFTPDWALTAGVRYDRYSDFGGTTNPRLALVWDATLDLTAKLLYGRAFRAPAFTELYSVNNPVIRANPNLKPETIDTLETAFSWQARKDTQVNLNIFYYEMNDIIRTETDLATGISTFNNTGRQNGRGMELEVVHDVARNLRVSGHYAYQHSIDEATHQDAGYAPHNHVYARTDWGFTAGWLFGGQVNYVADRKRAPGDTRPTISDYTTVDLTLRTNRSKDRWDFAASVRNLFDADVREPSQSPSSTLPNDLPMAGRSFYLQMSHHL